MLKTLWTDIFGSHRTSSSKRNPHLPPLAYLLTPFAVVRRASAVVTAWNVLMWAFWILIAISTVVLVLSTVREYLRRKKLVKRNEQQRVVDDITAETV